MFRHVTTLAIVIATLAACERPTAGATGPVLEHGAAAAPLTQRRLQDIVAGAVAIRVSAAPANRTIDVKDPKVLAAVLKALGADRTPTLGMSRCLTPYRLAFLDGGGRELASVGLCDSAGLAPSARSAARVDVPGAMAGFEVADLGALRAALKPAGIDLP